MARHILDKYNSIQKIAESKAKPFKGHSKSKALHKAKGLVGNSHLDNHGVNSPAMKASSHYKGEFK